MSSSHYADLGSLADAAEALAALGGSGLERSSAPAKEIMRKYSKAELEGVRSEFTADVSGSMAWLHDGTAWAAPLRACRP